MIQHGLELIVILVSSLLIIPAQTYRILWQKWGRLLPALGFLLLSVYAILILEDLFQKTIVAIAGIECSIVSLYTTQYADIKYSKYSKVAPGILYTLTNIFGLLIVLSMMAGTILGFVVFFVLAGLIGFFVVAFDFFFGEDNESWRAAVKYLIASMVPSDIAALALAGVAVYSGLGWANPTSVILEISPPILLLILLGFSAKAAVAPLHFWIADAHSVAPAPCSALLSGLMVKMGVYGLYVTYKASNTPFELATLLTILSAATVLHGGASAIFQDDMKRILAYSTMSHTSLMSMFLALGEALGSDIPIKAVSTYAVAHSAFKSSLFLDSGFIELTYRTRSVSKVRGVASLVAIESLAVLISIASLMGVPPTLGFFSKLFSYTYIVENLDYSNLAVIALIVLALKTALGAGYALRYLIPHLGRGEGILEHYKYSDLWKYTLTISLLNLLAIALIVPIIINHH